MASLEAVIVVSAIACAFVAGGLVRSRRRVSTGGGVKVGIDIVEVSNVVEALSSRKAERYLQFVYTDSERRDCETPNGIDPTRLAARFAAKEAVCKVLGPEASKVPWRAVEVVRGAGGVPRVALDGLAATLARDAGLKDFSISLSHEPHYATAVVVATR